MTLLCRDCKFSGEPPIVIERLCQHPQAVVSGPWDMLGATEPKRHKCWEFRGEWRGSCGADAEYFKERT